MCGQDGVVWFYNSGGDLWGGVDGEFQLGFLSVIDGETFHEEGGESGSGTTTEGVEDQETLKTGTLIGKFSDSESGSGTTTEGVEDQETLETGTLIGKLSDSVEDKVDDFFTDGVVTTGVVVGGILFAGDQLFGVEQLTVGTGADLIDDSWFKIDEDGSWDVLSSSSFTEEGVEGIITTSDGLVTWHLTIRLDTVLKTVQFPAGVTDLDTGLSDVD